MNRVNKNRNFKNDNNIYKLWKYEKRDKEQIILEIKV